MLIANVEEIGRIEMLDNGQADLLGKWLADLGGTRVNQADLSASRRCFA